jgi:glutamyl-tRNA reductase
VVPTIVSLKEKAEAVRTAELTKSLNSFKTLTPEQREAIEALTLSITEKIIHDPILVLKGKADRTSRDLYLDIARTLFKLDEMNQNGSQDEDV